VASLLLVVWLDATQEMTVLVGILIIIGVLAAFFYVAGTVRGAMDRRIGDVEWHFDAIEEELKDIHPKLAQSHTKQQERFTESSF